MSVFALCLSGSNLTGPIYMGCAGKVFDVTGGASFYGPGGAYGGFAGTDASRGLAKMDLKPSSYAVDDLGPAEKQTLKEVSSSDHNERSTRTSRYRSCCCCFAGCTAGIEALSTLRRVDRFRGARIRTASRHDARFVIFIPFASGACE